MVVAQSEIQEAGRTCPEAASPGPSAVWIPGIIEHIASFMPENEVACNVRLVDKATAALLTGPQHITVRLSQPAPPDAFAARWAARGATRSLTLAQRVNLVALTASSGSLTNLEVALTAAAVDRPGQACELAAAAGHIHVCRWLLRRGFPVLCWSGCAAARAGRWDVFSWLLEQGAPWSESWARAAARGGHADRVLWILAQRPKRKKGQDPKALWSAVAEGCCLADLQRLLREAPDGPNQLSRLDDVERSFVLGHAAASPTPDWQAKVAWLESQGCARNEVACQRASQCEDAVERLPWLMARGYPADLLAAHGAAACGNLSALEDLLKRGALSGAVDDFIAWPAAKHGHLDALRLLHAHGVRVGTPSALVSAARSGHLTVVVWMVEALGCQPLLPSHRLLRAAAASGSRELMLWLRERGCAWDTAAFADAVESGNNEEALEWLVEAGCPMPTNGHPYLTAVEKGDYSTLRCLRRLGCPWGPSCAVFTSAVAHGAPLPLIKWLHAEGCPMDWQQAYDMAWRYGGRDAKALRAWLREYKPRGAGVQPSPSPAAVTVTVAAATLAAAVVVSADVDLWEATDGGDDCGEEGGGGGGGFAAALPSWVLEAEAAREAEARAALGDGWGGTSSFALLPPRPSPPCCVASPGCLVGLLVKVLRWAADRRAGRRGPGRDTLRRHGGHAGRAQERHAEGSASGSNGGSGNGSRVGLRTMGDALHLNRVSLSSGESGGELADIEFEVLQAR
ncbi:hypothetical protein GPECTOR_3g220 [Gonium pectorale]|uniref:Ankyrin repeat domain-containing protein n=1 Tax=Gonium pectorale TaxID=33097 RepID=A0A150GZ92_GONPE|nr:hypothetical protein GPECTOR_3g220 [Gonium pectorale]|eukprot:KXZ55063.1 hypothetical protein GPECTOR_3g220 [Gonium pectorale]